MYWIIKQLIINAFKQLAKALKPKPPLRCVYFITSNPYVKGYYYFHGEPTDWDMRQAILMALAEQGEYHVYIERFIHIARFDQRAPGVYVSPITSY